MWCENACGGSRPASISLSGTRSLPTATGSQSRAVPRVPRLPGSLTCRPPHPSGNGAGPPPRGVGGYADAGPHVLGHLLSALGTQRAPQPSSLLPTGSVSTDPGKLAPGGSPQDRVRAVDWGPRPPSTRFCRQRGLQVAADRRREGPDTECRHRLLILMSAFQAAGSCAAPAPARSPAPGLRQAPEWVGTGVTIVLQPCRPAGRKTPWKVEERTKGRSGRARSQWSREATERTSRRVADGQQALPAAAGQKKGGGVS